MTQSVCQLIESASKAIDKGEATLILAKILQTRKEHFIAHPEELVDNEKAASFFEAVEKVKAGFPATYILGTQAFWKYDFKVTPDVLIPRPDTETLLEVSLELLKGKASPKILDLGTGSGILAICLALEIKGATVYAADISQKALCVAKENTTNLKANVTFIESDWFNNISKESTFDLIICNPPYIRSDDAHLGNLTFEPLNALTDGADGLTHYKRIIDEAPCYLVDGGVLAFEHGFDQASDIRTLFKNNTHYQGIASVKDLGGRERVTYAVKSL